MRFPLSVCFLLLAWLAGGWSGPARAEFVPRGRGLEQGGSLVAQFQPGPNPRLRPRAASPQGEGRGQGVEAPQAPPSAVPGWGRRFAPGRAGRDQQAEHFYRIGRAYIEQGYYGEGLEALNQALALRPDYGRALTYKGIALRRLSEPHLALELFNEALKADPGDGVAHGERGLTWLELGEPEKADEDLRLAGRFRPDLISWFAMESRRVAAMAEHQSRHPGRPPLTASSGADDAGHPAPGRHRDRGLEPVPDAPDAGGEVGRSDGDESAARRPLFDWDGARSLARPALVFAAGLLGVLMVLLLFLLAVFRLALGLLRRLTRLLFGRTARAVPAFSALARSSFRHPRIRRVPAVAEPLPAAGGRGGSSLVRHGLWLLSRAAVMGLLILLVLVLPALVQGFRLDADRLTAPRVRPTVLDCRGNVYTHLGVPDTPVKFGDLPRHLVDALRAREDSRFFEHHGVDWIGFARAVLKNLRHMRFKEGASTLTMQLVEKAYNLDQKGALNRIRSKFVEWILAHRGEAALARRLGDRRAAKEAIMTAYLNRVEFGGGTVGVGAAAQYYFGKPVSRLTLGESCMLVALLRAPTANSPYRNPENSRLARDAVVAQMLRRGYITEEQAKQARFYVVDNPKRPRPEHNGYLVAAITREMNALKAQGKLPADVWEHEDLTIHSTLDLWAQEILDSEIRKVCASFPGDTRDDPLLGAGMVLDNATGEIRALVSGQDYSRSQYDLAFMSRRQVASLAKPFVYAAWLEQGGDITDQVSNAPLGEDEVRALGNWNPGNVSSLKAGEHPLSAGLAFSDNLMTVRVGLNAGLERVYETLFRAGLLSDMATTGPTWLLGTFDSSLANVVSAYSAFPRGGTRVVPHLVRSVVLEGREVYRAEPREAVLFTQRTCLQIHEGLREAMTKGTGRTAMRNADLDARVAGKTGTSQNAADVWWVGYVKDLTLGVRFGRDSNASLGQAAAGGTLAAPAAARVLKKLSERYAMSEGGGAKGRVPGHEGGDRARAASAPG